MDPGIPDPFNPYKTTYVQYISIHLFDNEFGDDPFLFAFYARPLYDYILSDHVVTAKERGCHANVIHILGRSHLYLPLPVSNPTFYQGRRRVYLQRGVEKRGDYLWPAGRRFLALLYDCCILCMMVQPSDPVKQ